MTDTSPSDIELSWQGPFTWFGDGEDSIFAGRCAETSGVYVWTVPIAGAHRVFYVGQTEAGFANRHHEHFREYFGGAYSIYEPGAFAQGRLQKLYHGYAYRKPRWRQAAKFHRRFPDLVSPLVEHLHVMRFFIAPLPEPTRIQRRVETALMEAVYALLPRGSGQLLEPGLRLEPRREDENPIAVTQGPAGTLEDVPDQFIA